METQPVFFTNLGSLKFGDKFVIDMEDVFDATEVLMFLSFAYDGNAMVSAHNSEFVQGFKTGLTKDVKVIKLSH